MGFTSGAASYSGHSFFQSFLLTLTCGTVLLLQWLAESDVIKSEHSKSKLYNTENSGTVGYGAAAPHQNLLHLKLLCMLKNFPSRPAMCYN